EPGLELAVRHAHVVVVGLAAVTDTAQHVRDRIGHRHRIRTTLLPRFRVPGGSGEAATCGDLFGWSGYQLLFVTPGSSPRGAMSRRNTRQRPNLRYTDLGRPHRWHRVYARTANFDLRDALTLSPVLATVSSPCTGSRGESVAPGPLRRSMRS